nr:riboflavin transporter 2-like isoform X2 [Parasteatoda tepidariorum]
MWLVDILSAGFGIGSWIAMTGLWVELPLLVQRLPEGWALASQLSLFLQVANIGPILYGLLHHCWPRCTTERAATHFQLAVGTLSTFLLIFMWHWTFFGRSIPFFILSFGLSLVDCTSSVVFLPFMANFRSRYLTPYLVGEGVSGLLPSLVAMAQGIANPECVNETHTVLVEGVNITEVILIPLIKEPRFEPEWFFAILLVMVLLSWIAFIVLDRSPSCKKEKLKYIKKERNCYELVEVCEEKKLEEKLKKQNKSRTVYFYLLFLQLWASIITFGVFPAIQVVCWVAFMFAFSYIKTMVTIILGDDYGHRALFWCGAVTQGGAVLGAFVMFLLVNLFDVFEDKGMCIV